MKVELASICLTLDSLKEIQEEVVRNIAINEFDINFKQWLDCCIKCAINREFIGKTPC